MYAAIMNRTWKPLGDHLATRSSKGKMFIPWLVDKWLLEVACQSVYGSAPITSVWLLWLQTDCCGCQHFALKMQTLLWRLLYQLKWQWNYAIVSDQSNHNIFLVQHPVYSPFHLATASSHSPNGQELYNIHSLFTLICNKSTSMHLCFCVAECRLCEAAVVRLPLDQCGKTGICGESDVSSKHVAQRNVLHRSCNLLFWI